jgi:hypothetical protein
MKSLLRFALLFVLIIIGKMAKNPAGLSDMTKAVQVVEEAPVQTVSLLQQLTMQSTASAEDSNMWPATVTSSTPTSSFQ